MTEYISTYPIVNVTVDVIVRVPDARNTDGPFEGILLITRKNDPFKGKWAFPGGFVNPNETVFEAASRELKEETSLCVPPSELGIIGVASKPGRDPRGWIISIVMSAIVFRDELDELAAADDAASVALFDRYQCRTQPENFAFDHWNILYDRTYPI